MDPNSKKSNNGPVAPKVPNTELSIQSIESILEIQKQKVKNEAAQIAFREKELQANVELSKKAMDHDAELEKKKPAEQRKTFVFASVVAFVFAILLLAFMGFCLYIQKEQFLIEFFRYSLYPALTGAGYYFGRKSKQKKNKSGTSPISDAEVVEES